MCPLMQAYKEIRRYGDITYDAEYTTTKGYCVRIVIEYDDIVYRVLLINGDVRKIEMEK